VSRARYREGEGVTLIRPEPSPALGPYREPAPRPPQDPAEVLDWSWLGFCIRAAERCESVGAPDSALRYRRAGLEEVRVPLLRALRDILLLC